MMRTKLLALAVIAALAAQPAQAQNAQPVIPLQGGAPISPANPLPVGQGGVAPASGTAGFPPNSTPLGGSSGSVAAAAATATLTAAATGKIAYISGFEFTSTGATTGAEFTCTVTGLAIGTQTYIGASVTGVTLINQPIIVTFNPPQPASAINTNIVASCPSVGAGSTNAAMNAKGYLQ